MARARERLWYAVWTRSRHEKRVAECLEEEGVEWFLPLVDRVRRWSDRRKIVSWPLFPGYVFARARREEFGTIVRVRGVEGGIVEWKRREVLVVRVDLIQQGAAVTLPPGQVEPLAWDGVEGLEGAGVSSRVGAFPGRGLSLV